MENTVSPTGSRSSSAIVRTGVAVGALLVLGIAAYGFGFTLSQAPLARQPFIPVVASVPPAPTIAAAVCNEAPAERGGGGRCYVGCTQDTDCLGTATVEACRTFAATVCGSSATCVAQLCGPDQPVCFNGFCTRPTLGIPKAVCATPTPHAQNVCDEKTHVCSADGAACDAKKPCVQLTVLPGKWIGLCPSVANGTDVAVANCTPEDIALCRIRTDAGTTARGETVTQVPQTAPPIVCVFRPGRCEQVCGKATDCPARSVAACAAEATQLCTNAQGVLDTVCQEKARVVCQRPAACAIAVGKTTGYCSVPLEATTAEACAALSGQAVWNGFCSNNPTKSCQNTTDCQ